ncbi:MAG: molybdopterin-synthase adenylyltransferase MoeB [Gammaproteobacteria bacterium]|nr:molybdopterin-synthase adenylyltransferase MoeB [Gammaproteobacteria bacterium]MDH5801985.1 molybdopterin-synthase adenylyltransferase MoeB [Gammaproteobacteria bacterium]
MNDEQLLRYARQIMLPQLEFQGQTTLLESRVAIIGMGGLGSPAAMYLAAAGVGQLDLCDFDTVDLSNLQRQLLHTSERLGEPKTQSAAKTLKALNPEVKLHLHGHKLSPEELHDLITQVDAVVDASDNFETRFLLNRLCVQTRTALISGAAIRMEGQVTVFRNDGEGPCYRCLYKVEDAELEQRCSETGVLAPLTGIIGSIQATETIKVLLNMGQDLNGRLLVLDAFTMEWRSIKLRKDPACPVCK